MKFLHTEQEFEEHKNSLDEKLSYSHIHFGKPKQYPCVLKGSLYNEDEYFTNSFKHSFIYADQLEDIVKALENESGNICSK